MFWGVTLESGKRYSQVVESSYHLSMAALEPKEGSKPNKYVSVMIEHGKTEFMLCTLEYDRVMQIPLDLLFVEGEEVSFFLNGEGTVHLTGYVTDNEDKSLVLSDQSDEESEVSDAEDTSYGKLLSMDIGSESTDEEWTPEKVSKEKKKLKTSPSSKLKPTEEKLLAKQNAMAASTNKTKPAEQTSPINLETDGPSSIKEKDDISSEESDEDMDDVDEDSDEDEVEETSDEDEDEEISDESEDDEEEESDSHKTDEVPSPSKKKKSVENDKGHTPDKYFTQIEQKKGSKEPPSHKEISKLSVSTQKVPINEGIINRKLEISKEKPDGRKLEIDLSPSQKIRRKLEIDLSPSQKDNTPKTIDEDSATSQSKKKKKRFSNENRSFSEEKSFTSTPKQPPSGDLVSGTLQDTSKKSIDTPATKRKTEIVGDRTKPKTPFRNNPESSNVQRAEAQITPSSKNNSNKPETGNEGAALSTGKKKKKKRSHSEDKPSAEDKSFTEAPLKDTPSTKLAGGVKVTDVKQGNGPQAKKGRFVHICYVGRLSNGEEFDSARDRPFSFRLGRGEVIKGLDTGIEGMKVGGKRKLVVPPNQGYSNKRVGPIPPNSTLLFEVELKAVS